MNVFAILEKIYKKLPVIAFDICTITITWYLAYWLRFNLQPFPANLTSIYSAKALFALIAVQTACYYYFKIYRGLWRFASIGDMFRIIKAIVCATILFVPVLYSMSLLQHIPRSVFPLYALIQITILCGARILTRVYHDRYSRSSATTAQLKRVLVVGAGVVGETVLRNLKRHSEYTLVGLVDDDPLKQGLEIHGIRVLGVTRQLIDLVYEYHVELILIAIPSARSAAMRRIVGFCEKTHIPFRTLPALSALASGEVEITAFRDVHIEDLLGRDQVQLDWGKISSTIANKRVLVTGGGGSIGSELCRQIMALNPQQLIIIENSEYNLYLIERELRENFPEQALAIALLSVVDEIGINACFEQYKPQIVFHAAAFKHVPMLEEQIRVAIQNNIIGTKVVAEASIAVNVDKFILISTDKAVNPTNVMGTTKRVAEIYCQNLNSRVDTQFITVRFGNVLGSAGSVVPLFKRQLLAGGPLTVTHPDIERFFMTIPEACQLILQAMVNGFGSEIFVLDMGEPIKISYLAEQIIRLAGKVPGRDIAIEYTGLRPGEKLFEELFHKSEQLSTTAHEKLFKAKFRQLDWQELTNTIRLMDEACNRYHIEALPALIKSLVPEFQPAGAQQEVAIIE